MGMMAGTSLLVSTATSLHNSQAQLNGHGQVGTGTGTAHPCAGHVACMQREGVSLPQHLLSSQDLLAPVLEPCGHCDQQETLRACQVFLQQATLSALGPLPGTRGVTVRFVQLALSFPVLLSSLPRIMS